MNGVFKKEREREELISVGEDVEKGKLCILLVGM